MRRVKCSLAWKAKWWEDRAERWKLLGDGTAEGVRAYAFRQVAVIRSIETSFTQMWNQPSKPPGPRENSGEDGPDMFVDPLLESIVESHEDE